ncbi:MULTISPECIES: DUF397 domain-containing protein [Streptomyces]|uniref:DUF397 domain-containing protein n=1 Tax=Streptomyces wadayamensis TaxID=141454 RepID=A0ABR4S7U3_9ACTN|nr:MULTISPECIES: DUF397 domain-containing protein [Streptomyces]MYX86694.1 DUF397 domain-containing protein [Streptomyces sp. SID4915]SCE37191.1 protein of unknown function [Streptomyces sp. IgraMP-1]AMM10447.1 regulatory protein [Streptomyces albidoflavus]KDR61711.1 hypothetical protein DC60_12395 [Streptomyces wadayamensis]QXQ25166.1 DUF397 domain-containing protein [Streptomyces albidoflavus]
MNADLAWVKSSYSSADGGNCLEWAPSAALATGAVPVRDSKDTGIPGFTVSGSAWSTFVGSLKTQG